MCNILIQDIGHSRSCSEVILGRHLAVVMRLSLSHQADISYIIVAKQSSDSFKQLDGEHLLSGASSGFQPNQGKNTKILAVVKIISYKRCLKTISVYFTQALQKSFHASDIFLHTL